MERMKHLLIPANSSELISWTAGGRLGYNVFYSLGDFMSIEIQAVEVEKALEDIKAKTDELRGYL